MTADEFVLRCVHLFLLGLEAGGILGIFLLARRVGPTLGTFFIVREFGIPGGFVLAALGVFAFITVCNRWDAARRAKSATAATPPAPELAPPVPAPAAGLRMVKFEPGGLHVEFAQTPSQVVALIGAGFKAAS